LVNAVDEWHQADSKVVAWDAALLIDGSPIPAEDSVTYYVYSRNEDGSNVTLLGSTNALQYTVNVPADTKFIVGVSAERTMASGDVTEQSAVNWSDDPNGNQGGTFGVSNIRSAAAPGGFRPQ
jgi:hypothetical protein